MKIFSLLRNIENTYIILKFNNKIPDDEKEAVYTEIRRYQNKEQPKIARLVLNQLSRLKNSK